MDMAHDPYQDIEPSQLVQALGDVDEGSQLRLRIKGEDELGEPREFVVLLPVPAGENGGQRMDALGLMLIEEDGKTLIDNVTFASQAADLGLAFDQHILKVRAPTDRMRKEIMWIPGLLLLLIVSALQWRRKRSTAPQLTATDHQAAH